MKNNLPEQIYLQAYSEDGQLLNASKDEVTWCTDQINGNDAIYILATPELVALLERLASNISVSTVIESKDVARLWRRDTDAALALAARIREALALEANDES